MSARRQRGQTLAGALIGALVGVGSVLFAIAVADVDGQVVPYTVFIVLAVALVGLALGAAAAGVTFVAGAAALVVHAIVAPRGLELNASDVVRLAAFVMGSPAVVFLVWRGETARDQASAALAASRAAEAAASREQEALEATRTELNQALSRAERERARLEEVAESIPEPVVVYDDSLRGIYGNRAALRLFGRSFVERPLDEWARTTEPRDERGRALEYEAWPQVVAQASAFRRRMVVRVPMSGRDMMVDVEGTPIPGGGAILLMRDVGKEEDARRRLSRFASFVAHELRNPLAVAKARVELALRDTTVPARIRNHTTRALESVDSAIGILERLELYSRADSGTMEATREPFELRPAITAAVERLRAEGSDRPVKLSIPDGVRAIGDRPLAEQVITNLLTNADRYSTSGAPIHVEVDAGDLVTLTVRDEGPGISDDVATRLFVDRMPDARGLGLGLYLVHASMQAMGGSVTLERRRPNAVFAVRWLAVPIEPASDD